MIYLGLFLLSLSLTYSIKWYALHKAILDIPNERSSHTIATPRGGGLAIILTFYGGVFLFKEYLSTQLFMALFTALPIVVISLLDDVFTLSSKVRLMVQAFCAILALYFLGGINHIDLMWFELTGWWLNIVAFLFMIWLTNLYNFLDGIDGYAGSQTVMVGIGLTLFFANPLGLVLVVASLGFLVFNWHKASIFMGDVGSATLGFIMAILIFSDTSSPHIYFWLVMLSWFGFDATLTLIRRYRNGENITQAHRKHAYQRLVQSGWSHAQVSLGLILVNALFLLLLDFIPRWDIVFVINLVILYGMMYHIDKEKSFASC